jgi:Protein of unknown function (DUF4197)
MKNILALALSGIVLFTACTELNKALSQAGAMSGAGGGALTAAEIVQGLKEALNQGTNKGVAKASAADGFFKNPLIFIPFPPAAQKVKNFCLNLGLKGQVDKFEMTLNRAAEDAAKEAGPIFLNAIKTMTVQDGLGILRGADTAATNYLRTKCTADMITKFKPKVQAATQKVELTKHWTPLASAYNKVPTNQPVNPDLDQYVTDKGIDGVFKLVGQEEKNIRTNPAARGTQILQKVFGSKENPHSK